MSAGRHLKGCAGGRTRVGMECCILGGIVDSENTGAFWWLGWKKVRLHDSMPREQQYARARDVIISHSFVNTTVPKFVLLRLF